MRIVLSLALCVVIAGAVMASGTETQPVHRHHKSYAAAAQAHTRLLRQEGLSRNASDCAKYGCLAQN
jgi:hypothetical protein